MLREIRVLNDYPSGSALAYLDGRIYLAGDDASHILIMDSLFNPLGRIELFETAGKRIPWNIKPDIEAITVVQFDKKQALLITGSGSLETYRNYCWLIDPKTNQHTQYELGGFYKRLKADGIKDLNIEGAATVQGQVILASRGNKGIPKNFLIFTPKAFWQTQDSSGLNIVKVGVNTDTAFFNGISGLDYSYRSDMLLLTVSTENTYSSRGDGEIGKSYLWMIRNISSKKRYTAINPDRMIDLEEIDPRFKKQKIESVCILNENKKEMDLLLVSDDDKGGTVLFKLTVDK